MGISYSDYPIIEGQRSQLPLLKSSHSNNMATSHIEAKKADFNHQSTCYDALNNKH